VRDEVFLTPPFSVGLFFGVALYGNEERKVVAFAAVEFTTGFFGFFFALFSDEVEEHVFDTEGGDDVDDI
jgi:hypothetical protein